MNKIALSLLRGVCQLPAYVAYDKGFFKKKGLDVQLSIAATAWMIPQKLASGECQFAVIPWTRVAAAEEGDVPLVVICGSGHEEAAIVLRKGVKVSEVRKVAVPQEGGMKDLTAMGLLKSLGWEKVELLRLPSGDAAILSFVGGGADAASMVEPYATMLERLGMGTVVKRTGDLWPGAPGCSLTTTAALRDREPELVRTVVQAYLEAMEFVHENPKESSQIAGGYIGVDSDIIFHALKSNRPRHDAVRNQNSMDEVLNLMKKLGYIREIPRRYLDLSFLDQARPSLKT